MILFWYECSLNSGEDSLNDGEGSLNDGECSLNDGECSLLVYQSFSIFADPVLPW